MMYVSTPSFYKPCFLVALFLQHLLGSFEWVRSIVHWFPSFFISQCPVAPTYVASDSVLKLPQSNLYDEILGIRHNQFVFLTLYIFWSCPIPASAKLESKLWKMTCSHSLKTSKIASATSGVLFLHSLAGRSSAGLLASGGSWEDFSTRQI